MVEYRRLSRLAPIHATIPPNYANAGHRQKQNPPQLKLHTHW